MEPRCRVHRPRSVRALSDRLPSLSLPPELLESGPSVVGATGGSGTRVVARILREAGLFTGTDLNESEDAWKFGDYSDRWINVYLSHRGDGLPAQVEKAMLDDLGALLAEHCAPVDQRQRWGWKEPRSIYLLEFLDGHLPNLRFLHVVRDGRDMAVSGNQNQLRKHGDAAAIPADMPTASRSIALWSRVNLVAARYGEARLGDRYLRIKFEELCARPVEIAGGIIGFLGLRGDAGAALDALVTPRSLGRWQHEEPATIAALEEIGEQGLTELGYELATR